MKKAFHINLSLRIIAFISMFGILFMYVADFFIPIFIEEINLFQKSIVVLIILFIVAYLLSTRFIVMNGILVVRTFTNVLISIPISSIQRIGNAGSLISILYWDQAKYKYRTILPIKPAKLKDFVKQLQKVNPDINFNP